MSPSGAAFSPGCIAAGIYYSPDGGRSWEPRSEGITIEHVFTLGCTVENGEPVILAGTEPVSVFCSRDEGRSW